MSTARSRRVMGSAAALTLAVTGGLWATSATADHPTQSLGEVASADVTEPATSSSTAVAEELVEVDDLGNVRKALGEAGSLVTDADEELFSISVNTVTPTNSCPSRAENLEKVAGKYLVIEVSVSVRSEIEGFADGSPTDTYFPLLPETFVVMDPEGEVIEGTATAEAWECFSDDLLLPSFVFPGERVSGIVVLDASIPAGSIAYMPAEAAGWQWQF